MRKKNNCIIKCCLPVGKIWLRIYSLESKTWLEEETFHTFGNFHSRLVYRLFSMTDKATLNRYNLWLLNFSSYSVLLSFYQVYLITYIFIALYRRMLFKWKSWQQKSIGIVKVFVDIWCAWRHTMHLKVCKKFCAL